MRLSFPPLKLWLPVALSSLALAANLAAQTAILVPPVYKVADFSGSVTGSSAAGVAEDSAGNLYLAEPSAGAGSILMIAAGTYGPAASGASWTVLGGTVSVHSNSALNAPVALAIDASGNLYVANNGGKSILEFPNAAGIPNLAATPVAVASGLTGPVAVAASANGSVFFLDGTSLDQAVAATPATPTVLSSAFTKPAALAVDPTSGAIYVADAGANKVFKLSPESSSPFYAAPAVFAGTGTAGYTGDAGTAASAELDSPTGVAVDISGNVYIDDNKNAVIRKVNPGLTISTVAGGTYAARSIQVNAYGIEFGSLEKTALAAPGPASEVSLAATGTAIATASPAGTLIGFASAGVTIDSFGRLLMPTGTGQILAMPTSLNLGAYSASSSSTVAAAQPWYLQNNTLSPTSAGNQLILPAVPFSASIADFSWIGGKMFGDTACAANGQLDSNSGNTPENAYCEILVGFAPQQVGARSGSLSASIATPALTLNLPVTGTGLGPIAAGTVGQINAALTAAANSTTALNGLAVNPWGAIFGADDVNGVIYQLSNGALTNALSVGGKPTGIAFDAGGNLYYADSAADDVYEIPVMISTSGAWSYTAPTTKNAIITSLANPEGVAFDAAGNLYVADYGHAEIKKYSGGALNTENILAGGVTTVIAGTGAADDGASGSFATAMALNGPFGVAVDANDNLYFVDQGNSRVIRVTGSVATVIASGLSTPWMLALDPAGNVYVQTTATTYLITAPASSSPVITAIAGSGAAGTPSGDGGPASAAVFSEGVPIIVAPSNGASGTPESTIYVGDFKAGGTTDAIRSITSANGAYGPNFGSITANPATPPTASVTLLNQGTAALTWTAPIASGPFTPSFTTAAWAASTAYAAGQQIVDANGNLETITTAGTSGSAAPAWSAATGATTADGGAIWTNQGLSCSLSSPLAAGASCAASVAFDPTAVGAWTFTPAPPTEAMPFGYAYASSSTGSLGVYAAGAATAPLVATTIVAAAGTPQSTYAGSAYATSLEALVEDQNGNPLAGVTVTFALPASGASGAFANGTTTTTAVTNSSGDATASVLTAGHVAGSFTATATAGALSASFALTNNDDAVAGLAVTLPPFVTAGQAATTSFTAVDQYGNVIPSGIPASFASTDAAAALPASGSYAGTALSVTFNTPGPQTLSATSTDGQNLKGSASTVVLANSVSVQPAEPVGTLTPAPAPVHFGFTAAGSITSIQVVTQGFTGLDFTDAGSDTCAVRAYAAETTCVVNVAFRPTAAGLRLGAVIVTTTNGVQTVYLSGTGQGSLIAFHGNTPALYSVPGGAPQVVVDPNGDLFYAALSGDLTEIPNHGGVLGTPVTFGAKISGNGIAMDGAGNLYYCDYETYTLYKVPSSNGTPNFALQQAISVQYAQYVAVDGGGDVFVISGDTGTLYEIAANSTTVRTVLTGIGSVNGDENGQALVMDASGNLYSTTATSSYIYKISNPAGSSPTVSTAYTCAGSCQPRGLGMDPAGDLYYSDNISGNVYEISNASGSLNFASPILIGAFGTGNGLRNISFDASGNLYLAEDQGPDQLAVLNQAPAPALANFGSIAPPSISAAQSATVANIGNQPLTFSSVSFATPPFNNVGSTCAVGSPVAAGAACAVTVDFQPTAVGTASGSVILTDNAVNEAAPQQIALAGTGLALAQTISFTLPSSTTYNPAAIALNGVATSGLPITYTVSGGGATLSGTSLLLAGPGTVQVTASQPGNSIYTAAAPVTEVMGVTTAPLTISGVSAASRPYNRGTAATIAGTAALNGVYSGDVANVSLAGTPTATFASSGVGNNIVVTFSGYTLSGTDAYRYSLAQPPSVTASITAAQLALSGLSVASKIYNGNAAASLTGTPTLSGVISGDTVTVGGTPTATFAQSSVGNGIAVTIAGYTLGGAQAGDYALSQPSGLAGDITAAPLSVAGIGIANKPYDGTTAATITGSAALSGVVNGDTVNLGGTPVAVFAQTGVGTGIAVTVSGYAISGGQSANYSLSQPTGLAANITQASQTISFGPFPAQIYSPSGNQATLAATASSNLPVTYAVSGPAFLSGNTVTITGAGTVTVIANQAGNANYTAALPVIEQIQIGQASQTISNFGPFPAGLYHPGLQYSLIATASSGLPIAYLVSGPATLSGSTLSITGAGTVSVTATQPGNADYSAAASVPQSISIAPGQPVINWIPTTNTVAYGLTLPAGLLDASVASPAGSIVYAIGGNPVSTSTAAPAPAGYTVTATFTPNDTTDYQTVTAQQTFTVTQTPAAMVISNVPAAIYAGGNIGGNVTVTVIDAFSNVVSGFSGPISVDLTCPGVNDDPTVSATLGVAAFNLSGQPLPAGTCAVTANSPGLPQAQQSVAVLPTSTLFPSTPVSPIATPTPQPETVQLLIPSTASNPSVSVSVVTQGAAGLDFTLAPGSACPANTAPGSTCAVTVDFAPAVPGLRTGAILVADANTGALLQTIFLSGTGTAPQISFLPGQQSAIAISAAVSNTTATALDAAGDMFVLADGAQLIKYSGPGRATQTVLATGLKGANGVAVDGAGNVWIANTAANSLIEIPWTGAAYAPPVAFNNGSNSGIPANAGPWQVQVDGAGNVFFLDYTYGVARELAWNGAGYNAAAVVAPASHGIDLPTGMAIDANDDVFITDSDNHQVLEFANANGAYAAGVAVPMTGLQFPSALAIDGGGNLYVADIAQALVIKVPWTGSAFGTQTSLAATTAVSNPAITGMALDSLGNIYLNDSRHTAIIEIDTHDAPQFGFLTTPVGATSADSPQTATAANIGNLPLAFTGVSVTGPNFNDTGSLCSGQLAPGGACALAAAFTPQAVGSLSDTLALSDNTLNVPATQGILLSGTGSQILPSINVVPDASSSPVYGGAQSVDISAVGGAGSLVPAGAYQIAVDGGTPATLALAGAGPQVFSLGVLSAGSHTVVVAYSGDPSFLAASGTATVSVAPAPLTVTVANATRAYGAANPTFTGTIVGAVNNDTINATYSSTAGPTTPVGAAAITATLAGPSVFTLNNYTVTNTPGVLTITQAATSVAWTASSGSIVYGTNLAAVLTATGTPGAITYADASGPVSAASVLSVGNYTITATLAGDANHSSSTATSTLTVTPAPLTVTVANATRAEGAVNPAFTATIAGIVSSDPINASYSTTATATSGVGAYPITATLAGPSAFSLSNYTVTNTPGVLTITPAAASKFVVTAGLGPITAGGTDPVTITAYDQYGNVVTGYNGSVALTLSTGTGSFTPITFVNGVGTSTETLDTAGSITIIAADGNGITGASGPVAVVAGAAVKITEISGGGQSATVGQPYASPAVVRLTDAYGNPVSGAPVAFSAPATGASAASLAASVSTLADGTATATFSANGTSGAFRITALATTANPATVVFNETNNAGAVAKFVLAGLPSTSASGAADGFTLTAEDSYGNIITGYAGPVVLANTDPAAAPATCGAFASGVATCTVTFIDGGQQTVTARDASNASASGSGTVTVTLAPSSVTWTPGSGSINFGTNLSGVLTATGAPVGAITYTDAAGPVTAATVLPAGTYTLTATLAATASHSGSTATFILTVIQTAQAITFPAISAQLFGTGPNTVTLAATSSAGLPIAYTVSGPATVAGNVLTLTGIGAVTVTANAAGSGSILAAPPVSQTFQSNPALAWGMYATASACNAISLSGNASVDSYSSALGAFPAGLEQANGNIGTNGNASLSGNAKIYGALYDPNGNTRGNCNGSKAASTSLTTSGNASVASGIVTLAQPLVYPAPAAPLAPPTSNQNTSGSCGSISGCTQVGSSRNSTVALAPGAYGNVTISGNAQVNLSAGTYVFNSLAFAGNGTLNIVSGPVIIDLAGVNTGTALDLTGGTLTNSLAPSQLEFLYAGSDCINLAGGSQAAMVVYAPNAPIALSGNAAIQGAIVGSTIAVTGNGGINYDRALAGQGIVPAGGTALQGTTPQTISVAGGVSGATTYGATVSLDASASSALPVAYSVTGPATVSASGVVTFTGVGAVTVTIAQPGNSVYSPAPAVTQSFTVAPAVLTVSATSQSAVYGAVDPDSCGSVAKHLAYTVAGFVNGDTASILSGAPSETTTAKPTSGVGTYPISIAAGSLSAGPDYTFAFVGGTETVTPATLTVAAARESKNLGQANPALTYTISGFVNNDSQSVVSGSPSLSTAATTNSPAGIYVITIAQGTLKAANYTFTFVNGALVVANCNNNSDPHCNGRGGYQQNDTWDCAHWPDASSYNYWWGN